jgi:gamma-glutamyltranspeptidase
MPAHRFPNAAVASPHYLASSAGLAALTAGGTAADAAIAMNLVLAVVYPHMSGLGGDLFAMVWHHGELVGLNSSGRLPGNAKPVDEVPRTGIGSATVPGCVAGLRALHQRYGKVPWDELTRPAIRYAREGVPRAPGLARITTLMRPLLEKDPEAAAIYLGPDLLVQPQLAHTLENLVDFYDRVGKRAPAPFTEDDFTAHEAEWVIPERTTWRGHEVCEMPPNSRGHLALRALDHLEPLDGLTPNDPEWHDRLIRALTAANADGANHPYLTSERSGAPSGLHGGDGGESHPDQPRGPGPLTQREPEGRVVVDSSSGDTIYLCAVDEHGMAVSLSQSLKDAFGSGVMIHGTGVLLQNRAADFTPEAYLPGAQVPAHTLAPAMVLRTTQPSARSGEALALHRGDGEKAHSAVQPEPSNPVHPEPVEGPGAEGGATGLSLSQPQSRPYLVFGTMGGPSQLQVHLQLLARIVVAGEDIADAIAAPRWRITAKGLITDPGLPDIGASPAPLPDLLGHAHAIMITDHGLAAAADPRSDGAALGY